MILARDGLVFKNLKIFRCKNELSRTYVQFEYGYYENGNPRKYCIDIQAQKDNQEKLDSKLCYANYTKYRFIREDEENEEKVGQNKSFIA